MSQQYFCPKLFFVGIFLHFPCFIFLPPRGDAIFLMKKFCKKKLLAFVVRSLQPYKCLHAKCQFYPNSFTLLKKSVTCNDKKKDQYHNISRCLWFFSYRKKIFWSPFTQLNTQGLDLTCLLVVYSPVFTSHHDVKRMWTVQFWTLKVFVLFDAPSWPLCWWTGMVFVYSNFCHCGLLLPLNKTRCSYRAFACSLETIVKVIIECMRFICCV